MGLRRDFQGRCCPPSRRFRHAARGRLLLSVALMAAVSSCGLLDSQKEQKPAEQPQQVAKIPLPPRGEQKPQQVAAPPGGAPEKTAAVQNPATPSAAPAPVKQAPPAAPVAKKGEAAGPATPLPPRADTGGQKQPAAAKAQPKDVPQPAKAQPVGAGRKPGPLSTVAKPAVAPSQKPAKGKTVAAPAARKARTTAVGIAGRPWNLVTGPYLLEETLANDLARLRKAGFSATVQPGNPTKSVMHRLFLAQYGDRAAAQIILDKLKNVTSDAFILSHGGRHAVYAGSYLLANRAQAERERLAAAGFTVTVKRIDVAVPSRRLVVGSYHDRADAETAARKLKAAGFKGALTQQ